jgi:small subunit ribosomal protein S1
MTIVLFSKYRKNDFSKLIIKYNYQIKIGDILAGKMIGIERKGKLIDIGLNQVAILPNYEFLYNNNQESKIIPVPKFSEFKLIYYNLQTHLTIISLRQVCYLKVWERFKQLDYNNLIFFSKVIKTIWRGKLVYLDGLNVFIPNFHLPKFYRKRLKIKQILSLKILEVRNFPKIIIGSCRLAIFKKYSRSISQELKGECYVIGIKSFGILVNIYGFRSLLHISEISRNRLENLNLIYRIGDKIIAKVQYINNSNGKITVSLK